MWRSIKSSTIMQYNSDSSADFLHRDPWRSHCDFNEETKLKHAAKGQEHTVTPEFLLRRCATFRHILVRCTDKINNLVGRKWMSLPTLEAIRAPKSLSKTNPHSLETTCNVNCNHSVTLYHSSSPQMQIVTARCMRCNEELKIEGCWHWKSTAPSVAKQVGHPPQPQRASAIWEHETPPPFAVRHLHSSKLPQDQHCYRRSIPEV